MIAIFFFVYLFAFATCKTFHASQHLPLQKYQLPLQYPPYQGYQQYPGYIPIYRPPTKTGKFDNTNKFFSVSGI